MYIRQKQNDYVWRRILCRLCNEISAIFGERNMMHYRPLHIRHLGGTCPPCPLRDLRHWCVAWYAIVYVLCARRLKCVVQTPAVDSRGELR